MSKLLSLRLLSYLFETRNFIFLLLFIPAIIHSQPVDQTFNTPGTFTYTVPLHYTAASIIVHVFGGGGGGGTFGNNNNNSAGGGGGGGYTTITYLNVPAGSFTVTVGAGGAAATNGGLSRISRAGYTTITGNGGVGGASGNTAGGAGGTATGGLTNRPGGNGGNGGGNNNGGAGGGASGSSAVTAANGTNATSPTGAAGGSAGGIGNGAGGAGGKGSDQGTANAGSGTAPGGGGGGRSDSQNSVGVGGNGRVIFDVITFLPIQLSSFDVIQAKHPVINWITVSELNTHHFSLGHSRDGNNFTEIANVEGQGTSDKRNDYTFTHRSPYPGLNHYELKQIDLDGTITIFPMKSVVVPIKEIIVYPTLVQNNLNIEIPDSPSKNWLWNIVDLQGHTIRSGEINSMNSFSIDLNMLYNGTYILQLKSDTHKSTYKVIKI